MKNWRELPPAEIERRSMEIIAQELGDTALQPQELLVLKRVIHTTADFSYKENLFFSPDAVEKGIAALMTQANILTDTNMAKSGINSRALEQLGCKSHCFMADEGVAAEAISRKITRAAVSMEKAAALDSPLIIAVGNAPTALLRLYEMIEQGEILPSLIIAAPVGFVNVIESKQQIEKSGVPIICARGRRGGSTVAAAICNALLYQAVKIKNARSSG